MTSIITSPIFSLLKRRRSSILLPPAANVVSEGFIEIVFFLLGVGILLPWNAYISAKQYFVSRLCHFEEHNGGGGIADHVEMWFSILYNAACVLSLAAVIFVQHMTDTKNSNNNNNNSNQQPSLFKSTSNLSLPMMCSKTLRIDTTRVSNDTSYTWYMVMIPLAVYLGVFAMTTIFVFIPFIPYHVFLIFTLLGLCICGVCTAIASSGIVGTAGLFDANLGVNPYFNGQAAGGLFVACANFLASIMNGSSNFLLQYCYHSTDTMNQSHDEETTCISYSEISWATAGYFGLSCIILAACMVGYSYVDEYKRLVRQNSFRGDPLCASVGNEYEQDIIDSNREENDNDTDNVCVYPKVNQHNCIEYLSIENDLTDAESNNDDMDLSESKWNRKAMVTFASYQNSSRSPSDVDNNENWTRRDSGVSDNSDNQSDNSSSVTMSVWMSVRGIAISLFFTYFCTLIIFPVWTSNLVSVKQCHSLSRIRNDLFVPLSFVIFNGGDLLGRSISSSIKFDKVDNLSNKLVWSSLIRMIVFTLLFLLCDGQNNRYTHWVLKSDITSWTIQFLFATTNGFLTNVAFCYAPTLVENRTNPQQVASAILNFSLSFGLLVGSFFSGPYFNFATGL